MLDQKRKLLGYIDVAVLKSKWEAGDANPVSLRSYSELRQTLYSMKQPLPLSPHLRAFPIHSSCVLPSACVLKDDKVEKYMTKFKRTASTPYTIISPSTPLAELEDFLKHNIFAIVTDWDRKFVLGVVTSHDLEVRSSFSRSLVSLV